ncbi:gamma carbonic anhydrase family protein [Aureimonas flava]|uniref:Gamma carbonic anhydrase family protein n=1 Tax=Aureimonas flava TaxID=2320271 RepID=A0A3A1WEZ0_9HYPH|nr:gamma carbonic anhydrase family protein [Aureimonas flava]RIX98000.1 gamma carbonic anhydrase family protein [Aureimonas flava]
MPLHALDDVAPTLADPDSVFIAPGAQVVGDVALGADVGVWFGAVIRGDVAPIRVGARTNVQDGAVLHADPSFPLRIGEDCTIGHRAIVHGCTVGDGTLIGMGATILNGARIGAGCLVGAGALVTEGKVFPDGSLIVGAPAKVVRALDAAAIAELRGSAERYVDNARRFKAGLKTL